MFVKPNEVARIAALLILVGTSASSALAQSSPTFLKCDYTYDNGNSRTNTYKIGHAEFRYLAVDGSGNFLWSENLVGTCVTIGSGAIDIDVRKCPHSNWDAFVEMSGVSISRVDGRMSGDGYSLMIDDLRKTLKGSCQTIENPTTSLAF